MSSLFRLSIIMVLVLATVALGFIAYTANQPKPVAQAPAAVEQKASETLGYFVAAHPLPRGTFVRDEDFEVRAAPRSDVPSGAILESGDARIELRGSLVRNFVEAGRPITSQDVFRPRDRGFVASVLAPDTRAISINVDMESGVSGLIWPGDYVDVVLIQTSDRNDRARPALSEILVQNVRIIAIDQEIVAGVSGANALAGKLTHSVSLQLSPEQVKKINLAKDLGKLSLAVRSAVEVKDTADTGAVFASDVSPAIACQNAIARQFTTVVVYAKGKHSAYTVRKQRIEDAEPASGCAGYPEMAPASAALAGADGEKAKE
jgi:pilus assembly protein CpaB